MTDSASLLQTPMHDEHVRLGARMVPFAGWHMPVQYSGVIEEARAVRQSVGLFDISHMGRFRIAGSGARTLMQSTTTNDVDAIAPGRAQYSLIPNAHGGIVDDIIVYCEETDAFMVVVNASNRDRDLRVFRDHADASTEVRDVSDDTAMMAVQGPAAVRMLEALAGEAVTAVPRFGFTAASLGGCRATLCRTGYTGEDGFEIIVDVADAETVWRRIREAGAVPCGLGARDLLRIEAGYPLYGHEIDDNTSPVEAGLMWAVKLDKGPFIGRDAISQAKSAGASRKLMGLVMETRAVPRQGYPIVSEEEEVGTVTSGAFSALRSVALGMGYVRADLARAGAKLGVLVRGTTHPCGLIAKKDLLTVAKST